MNLAFLDSKVQPLSTHNHRTDDVLLARDYGEKTRLSRASGVRSRAGDDQGSRTFERTLASGSYPWKSGSKRSMEKEADSGGGTPDLVTFSPPDRKSVV